MSPEREIERAQRIADLLANPYVAEALAEIEEEIVHEWKSGATLEERELASDKYRGLEAIRNKFRAFVDGGRIASTNMAKAKKAAL